MLQDDRISNIKEVTKTVGAFPIYFNQFLVSLMFASFIGCVIFSVDKIAFKFISIQLLRNPLNNIMNINTF